jgi:hypothetical protein
MSSIPQLLMHHAAVKHGNRFEKAIGWYSMHMALLIGLQNLCASSLDRNLVIWPGQAKAYTDAMLYPHLYEVTTLPRAFPTTWSPHYMAMRNYIA